MKYEDCFEVRRREDNIKMERKEIGCEIVNWILLVQDRVQLKPFLNTVM
jgi:hypothetical protein